jgi:acetoin utilization deacetylase AcuC-like enzyme
LTLKPMKTAIVSSPRFADHIPPPGHPERPERAEVFDAVADRWRADGGDVLQPRMAGRDELARIHTATYLDRLEALRGEAAMLDPDTFTSSDSIDRAELAAGAALTALDWVLAGDEAGRRALALVRPPGHHAEASGAMGFCFLNNVAIAAASAIARGVSRVAIVDFDVHHGNGTQHQFEHDPRVLFVSTHQYPSYPGTGAATEIGTGEGSGCTVNVPLEAGSTDGDYALVFDEVVVPVLEAFVPELLLVSAGYDPHERDPLAQMRVTTGGFDRMGRALVEVADRHARGRVLAITEGGYDLTALREGVEALLHAFAGAPPPATDMERPATGRGRRAVDAVRAAQAGRWRGL